MLPISSRSSRIRTSRTTKGKKKKKVPATQKVEEPVDNETQEREKLNLQDIPVVEEKLNDLSNLDEIPKEISEKIEPDSLTDIPSKDEQDSEEEKNLILQEIKPEPFRGTVLSNKKEFGPSLTKSDDIISDAFSELKQSVLDTEIQKPRPTLTPLPPPKLETDSALIKQKKLEKDMSEVLGFLSKKIIVKPKIPKSTSKKEPEDKLPPASMNEILKELIRLDSRIEASALIKTDGTMLASAVSSRISESLFGTIGINLSMISTDIIEGLSAGTLKSISVKGTEGILDLAFLDRETSSLKDMILILFSHPQVKSGIISIAISLIKKKVRHYLGLTK
ncbi:MAG: hypothetical protein ACW98D_08430 [Promethearchaeota archaeon]